MNNRVLQVAKFVVCAGVVIGAPLVAVSAVNFTTAEVEHYLEIAACKKTAQLDQITKECK